MPRIPMWAGGEIDDDEALPPPPDHHQIAEAKIRASDEENRGYDGRDGLRPGIAIRVDRSEPPHTARHGRTEPRGRG